MERYTIRIEKQAQKELIKIHKSGKKQDLNKIENIFKELTINPRIGIGKPERLKHKANEIWSREINKKDRLVYEIIDDKILVIIINTLGHYTLSK